MGDRTGMAKARRNVVIAAATAGLAGLLFGYDTGIIAGALLSITPEFGLSSLAAGMVVGAVPIGAGGGAWVASQRADEFGQARLIFAAAVLFIIGGVVSAIAQTTGELIAARIVIGLGIGIAAAVAPVYISEIAPAGIRGQLVTFFQLSVTVGILLAYVVGLAFSEVSDGWRWMLGLSAIPAMGLGLGMLKLPPSPRWLIMNGDQPGALRALRQIRPESDAAIGRELQEIKNSLGGKPAGWRELLRPSIRAALVVGIGLAILQQITGINTVIYYAPTIIRDAGINSASSAIVASLGVGAINVIMTLVALRLLDRAGRRTLLFIGVTGMSVSLFLLGAAFLGDSGTLRSVIAVFSLMLFVSSFAISLGPIFWLMNAEIYPLAVRSKAASLGTMTYWLSNFIVSLAFLSVIDLITQTGTFWLFGAIGLFTLWFCWKYVPETRGRSLSEIDSIFERRAGRTQR